MHIFVVTRKQLLYGLFAVLLLIGLCCVGPVTQFVIDVTGIQKTIVIDAGHGSVDPGCSYGDLKEKDINLQVAFLLKELLEESNFNVILTRTDDSLYNQSRREDILYRARKTNEVGADAFISIHVNKFPTEEPFGGQAYYYSGEASKQLAGIIQEQLKAIQPSNYRTIGFGDYYVLRKTNCPAVLVEIGFISNATDRERMTNPDEQRKIAGAIRKGLVDFFQGELIETIESVDVPPQGSTGKLTNWNNGYDLYFVDTNLQGEMLVPVHQSLPQDQVISVQNSNYNTFLEQVARDAILELIAGPKHGKLAPVLPATTRLLSLTIRGGLATINFSQNLVDDHWGGAKTEYLTVASIIKTLTAFPGIDRVQILIEGQIGQTIAGHIFFDEPFTSERFR